MLGELFKGNQRVYETTKNVSSLTPKVMFLFGIILFVIFGIIILLPILNIFDTKPIEGLIGISYLGFIFSIILVSIGAVRLFFKNKNDQAFDDLVDSIKDMNDL